jgi:hypothetical protein
LAQKPNVADAFGASTASYETAMAVSVEPDWVLDALHREATAD